MKSLERIIQVVLILSFVSILAACTSKPEIPSLSPTMTVGVQSTPSHSPERIIVTSVPGTPLPPAQQTSTAREMPISRSRTGEAEIQIQQTMTAKAPTATRTPTLFPSATYNPTRTKTLIPSLLFGIQREEELGLYCDDLLSNVIISPGANWIVGDCFYSRDNKTFRSLIAQDLETKQVWREDYQLGTLPWEQDHKPLFDFSTKVVRWSFDERYLYFTIVPQLDGPLSILTSGALLSRLDFETGIISEVLPASSKPFDFYAFSFSENLRWLAYTKTSQSDGIHLSDLKTGAQKSVPLHPVPAHIGNFVWTRDGQHLSFLTIEYSEDQDEFVSLGILATGVMEYRIVYEGINGRPYSHHWLTEDTVTVVWQEGSAMYNNRVEKTLEYNVSTGQSLLTEKPLP